MPNTNDIMYCGGEQSVSRGDGANGPKGRPTAVQSRQPHTSLSFIRFLLFTYSYSFYPPVLSLSLLLFSFFHMFSFSVPTTASHFVCINVCRGRGVVSPWSIVYQCLCGWRFRCQKTFMY
ncbi:hypothetical protein, unlikely [Trypanosoma brucei gambiense DAL972]|uniref:Uncharacterized protein n=1 Tax=Trypanosoma brucei gambiense (strain MHOM/CI/86/DAL972) TaxID=679716 RepID=C9ZWF0_TRYB9|nr:hypothetical protein, unlikely [Trypanosoma brucei gambiense DAL972]CBH13739.1 hypothetical protein, unlikely [Trypanosoma brucei gambiense DAL972]|eukprot:XP_011776015.1 hypothetical protein, unlikely [Trypanosoma brucei gambiense DAL972]